MANKTVTSTNVISDFVWLLVIVGLNLLSLLWNGYVLVKVWSWHVGQFVPAMKSLPLQLACAVTLICAHLTHQVNWTDKAGELPNPERVGRIVGTAFVALIILGYAWLLRLVIA